LWRGGYGSNCQVQTLILAVRIAGRDLLSLLNVHGLERIHQVMQRGGIILIRGAQGDLRKFLIELCANGA
jgi:hypothetical protein